MLTTKSNKEKDFEGDERLQEEREELAGGVRAERMSRM